MSLRSEGEEYYSTMEDGEELTDLVRDGEELHDTDDEELPDLVTSEEFTRRQQQRAIAANTSTDINNVSADNADLSADTVVLSADNADLSADNVVLSADAGDTPVYYGTASELNTSTQAANPSSISDSDDYEYDTDSASRMSSLTASRIIGLLRHSAVGQRLLGGMDDSSSDSEDEDPHYFMLRKRKPATNFTPDTSKIASNEIRLLTANQPQFSQDKSVSLALNQRSIGRQKKKRLSNHMIPNKQVKLRTFRNKVFCGIYGRDGDIFVSASQR